LRLRLILTGALSGRRLSGVASDPDLDYRSAAKTVIELAESDAVNGQGDYATGSSGLS